MFLELPIENVFVDFTKNLCSLDKIFLKISKEINLVKFFFHAPRTNTDKYGQIRTVLKSSFHPRR